MDTENFHDFVSWGGLVGATFTVLVTTLDDSVWLIPFVSSACLPFNVRILNAATFLCTLLGLAILCCFVAVVIQYGVSSRDITIESDELEVILESLAVICCWILAVGFYVRTQLKRRRQQMRQTGLAVNGEADVHERITYGALPQQNPSSHFETEGDSARYQPCTVMSLTFLGFLDEISYFPALVVGNIFTTWELCIGTMLAGFIMLAIQVFLMTQCMPLIQVLDDRLKLFHIITLFATILTIKLTWDLIRRDNSAE
eukprot:Nitzschia sp. Nitz4//scaffold21_size171442//57134//57904//NITZ4_002157-RA/size171442-exonerate_est2genome-gene-0.184-mRNA-1//-1//CDS//3329542399//3130//frame0